MAKPQPKLSPEKQALDTAVSLIAKKQYAQARGLLAPLAGHNDPQLRWPASFRIARSYQDEGNLGQAMPMLEQVSRQYGPLRAEALYWLGQAWISKRRIRTARSFVAAAEATATADFKDDCAYAIAYSHYLEGHYGQATELFRAFLKQYPTSNQAKSAERLLPQAQERLARARRPSVEWTGSIGLASSNEIVRWNQGPQIGIGANARLGSSLSWEPRDGMRVSANVFETRTSYLTSDIGDREGRAAGLTVTHDLGDLRSLSYGASYSENQRLDVLTSDAKTYGIWGALSFPVRDTGRLSASLNLSRIRYTNEASSGNQRTMSLSYSKPVTPVLSYTLGGSFTQSKVGAAYLSYQGPSVYVSAYRRLSLKDSLAAGVSYSSLEFAAPRPRQILARDDRQRRLYCEYTRRISSKISVAVGWQQYDLRSTDRIFNRTDPAWYLRLSQLLDVRL